MYIPYITDRPSFWSRVFGTLAFVACVLVAVNMYLFVTNLRLQREVTERQQFITQSAQIQGVAREIVSRIVSLAVKNNDEQLKQLLTSHGINVTVNPPSPTKDQRN